MTQNAASISSVQKPFAKTSGPNSHNAGARKKRPAPLSVRFSETELKALKKRANGEPLGAYIKSRVFEGTQVGNKRSAIQDCELLAQVLSSLGQCDVFSNLDKIAKAIERGDVCLSPEQEDGIALACLLVMDIRDDLIAALGLKPR